MVKRIESLEEQIGEVYREAGDYAGGVTNINAIREAVKAREQMRDAAFIAEGTLESFDVDEESA